MKYDDLKPGDIFKTKSGEVFMRLADSTASWDFDRTPVGNINDPKQEFLGDLKAVGHITDKKMVKELSDLYIKLRDTAAAGKVNHESPKG